MISLMRANFFKLFRSWSFWLTLFLLPFVNVFTIMNEDEYYMGLRPESGLNGWNIIQSSQTCFTHMLYLTYAAVILVGILIGDEYASGTVRNKLTAGHLRTKMYISYFLTSACECCIVHLFSVFSSYAVCAARYGYDGNFKSLAAMACRSVAPVIAASAFILFCIIAAGDQTSGMMIALFGDLAVMTIVDNYFLRKLQFSADKLSETAKSVYAALDSLIPSSYAKWFVYPNATASEMGLDKAPSCGWCLVTAIVFCAAGMFIFGKKDLK